VSLENMNLVLRGYKAFVDGDFDVIAELLDPDVEWHGVDWGPWDAGNRDGVLRVIDDRSRENFRVELEECVPVNDDVVVSFRIAGSDDEDGRATPGGRYFTIGRYAAVVTIRNCKVVRVQDYPSRRDALAAVGLEEPA
jgi:ketosteroid isomerase-like protein